ncbi:MAG: EAL domain-containing protein, partial [Proteobacteria bacterium]|nr:EAL domain-containing protein [Pseudomonadota bacterium]
PHYWLTLYPVSGPFIGDIAQLLMRAGAKDIADGGMALRTGQQWKAVWDVLRNGLMGIDALEQVQVSLTYGDQAPYTRAEAGCQSAAAIQNIAEGMWLGEALLEGRVMCYLQPVHSSKERVFGYESFARVREQDGRIIGGDKIVEASKALGIEYVIDRHLQMEAIKTFAASEFNGFLFVNFFPGFIHRPAVYLEGLSEAAKQYGIISKHIVLEFTNSERPRDLTHVKNVCDYGRSKGYSVALDDLSTLDVAQKLVGETRPDFVKIDMHLVQQVVDVPSARDIITSLVQVVHGAGGTIIAEGVETETVYHALRALGVDLFQGYYFAPPSPVDVALKRNAAS